MKHFVTLPYWLFVILLGLALWALLVQILVPGMRWYFWRRGQGVVRELKSRLNLELPDIKLIRRRVIIDRLVHDASVKAIVDAHAGGDPEKRSALLRSIDRYAREIVPSFNAYFYFRIGYWLAKRLVTSIYRVRLGYLDAAALERIDPRAALVFVINHRSNMDYLLVAFLAAERTALSYAVGEWARVWPLQMLLRTLGAYFVRRNSQDPLYRAVLQRYVQMATEAGLTQAVFPEGGLSRDGKMRAPKMGLIDYMVKSFDPNGARDLIFIPVAVNYDRVLEDRTLLMSVDTTVPKPGLAAAIYATLKFALKNLRLILLGRWYRFGYACVNFGTPVSMRDYVAGQQIDFRGADQERRRAAVETLARDLMARIARLVPVLPVPLVAAVFLRAPQRQFSELELKSAVFDLQQLCSAHGAHVYVPRRDQDYFISVGLRALKLRQIIIEQDGLFAVDPAHLPVLAYYANSIEHFTAVAAQASADVSSPAAPITPLPASARYE